MEDKNKKCLSKKDFVTEKWICSIAISTMQTDFDQSTLREQPYRLRGGSGILRKHLTPVQTHTHRKEK